MPGKGTTPGVDLNLPDFGPLPLTKGKGKDGGEGKDTGDGKGTGKGKDLGKGKGKEPGSGAGPIGKGTGKGKGIVTTTRIRKSPCMVPLERELADILKLPHRFMGSFD